MLGAEWQSPAPHFQEVPWQQSQVKMMRRQQRCCRVNEGMQQRQQTVSFCPNLWELLHVTRKHRSTVLAVRKGIGRVDRFVQRRTLASGTFRRIQGLWPHQASVWSFQREGWAHQPWSALPVACLLVRKVSVSCLQLHRAGKAPTTAAPEMASSLVLTPWDCREALLCFLLLSFNYDSSRWPWDQTKITKALWRGAFAMPSQKTQKYTNNASPSVWDLWQIISCQILDFFSIQRLCVCCSLSPM